MMKSTIVAVARRRAKGRVKGWFLDYLPDVEAEKARLDTDMDAYNAQK
jgi:hypothetical protein